jgi:hypothetical protein
LIREVPAAERLPGAAKVYRSRVRRDSHCINSKNSSLTSGQLRIYRHRHAQSREAGLERCLRWNAQAKKKPRQP